MTGKKLVAVITCLTMIFSIASTSFATISPNNLNDASTTNASAWGPAVVTKGSVKFDTDVAFWMSATLMAALKLPEVFQVFVDGAVKLYIEYGLVNAYYIKSVRSRANTSNMEYEITVTFYKDSKYTTLLSSKTYTVADGGIYSAPIANK